MLMSRIFSVSDCNAASADINVLSSNSTYLTLSHASGNCEFDDLCNGYFSVSEIFEITFKSVKFDLCRSTVSFIRSVNKAKPSQSNTR